MMSRKSLVASATVALALTAVCHAQAHKAGLWDVTTKTIIQKRGDVEGRLNASQLGSSADAADPGSLPACYSSDLINRYGVVLPPSLRDCELSNVTQSAGSFRADMVCKGSFNGKGSIESTWTDEDHVIGKVHFVSETRDAQPMIVRWTQNVTAVFKSADCGNMRPRTVPAKPAH